MTPVGHALAGVAVGRFGAGGVRVSGTALLALCVGLSLSPDLDFLPGLLQGQPALYHQGISHSIGFALGVSGIVAACLGHRGRPWLATFGLFLAAYASHLVIDLFGSDARPPYGIPLLWPALDSYYLAPFVVFRGVRHAASSATPTAEWFAAILSWYNLKSILLEVVTIAPFLLLADFRYRRMRRRALNTAAGRDKY